MFGRSQAFTMEVVEDSTFVIVSNRTQAWVSFVLFVVPSMVASAATFPWRVFLERIKQPDGLAKAGMSILYRLQQQFLNPVPDPVPDPGSGSIGDDDDDQADS